MPPFVGEEPPRPIYEDAAPVPQVEAAAAAAPACHELYVGNLPPSATSELLTELLLQVGPLQGTAHFPKDDAGTGHKGFAFAEFTDPRSVQYAIALFGGDSTGDGVRFGGRRLRVNEAGGGSNRIAHPTLAVLRELATNPRAWEGEVQQIPQTPRPNGNGYRHVGEGTPRPLPHPHGLSSGVPPAQAQAMKQQAIQQQMLLQRQQAAVRQQMLQQQMLQRQQPNMQMHNPGNPQAQMHHQTLVQMNHPQAQVNYYQQAQHGNPHYPQAHMNHQQAQMNYYPQGQQQQQFSQMQALEQQQAGGQQWGGGGDMDPAQAFKRGRF